MEAVYEGAAAAAVPILIEGLAARRIHSQEYEDKNMKYSCNFCFAEKISAKQKFVICPIFDTAGKHIFPQS